MRLTRVSLVLGMALALLALPQVAEAGKGGKGKGRHGLHGVVTDVAKDKDGGTLTVKVHQHKKKGAAAPAAPEEKKFRITAATKIERVSGSKGAREHKPATLAELQKGEHVVVLAEQGNDAQTVLIVPAHKKKGKGKAQ
jgi:hypothetical protein